MPAKAQTVGNSRESGNMLYREFRRRKAKYPRDHYGMPKTDTYHIEIFLYLIEWYPMDRQPLQNPENM